MDNNINDAIPVIAIIGISALRIIPSVHRATSAANNIAFGIPALDLLVNEIFKTKKSSLLKDKKEKIACDKLEVKNLITINSYQWVKIKLKL